MSTGITREPKICPSCGQENPPTAARCWLCFTPLGGAIQTRTAPAPGAVRLSAPLRTQPTGQPKSGCTTVGPVVGVLILTIISAGVMFFLVCPAALTVKDMLPPTRDGSALDVYIYGMFCLATVAAVLVAPLVIVAFVRRGRR